MKTNLWRDVPICVGIVVLLAPVFWPAPACGCSKIAVGLRNVKTLAVGLLEYAGDHDDHYPDRDRWRDEIAPYLKANRMWPDPRTHKGEYGYAFNAALSRAKEPADMATTPIIYDSVNPIRNASDLVRSLPSPGRYRGSDYVGYADGHVKAVRVR